MTRVVRQGASRYVATSAMAAAALTLLVSFVYAADDAPAGPVQEPGRPAAAMAPVVSPPTPTPTPETAEEPLNTGGSVAPGGVEANVEPTGAEPGAAVPSPNPVPEPTTDPELAVPPSENEPTDEAAPSPTDETREPTAVTEGEDIDTSDVEIEREDPWTQHPFRIWGFNEALRKNNIESYFGRFFYARRDQILTAARMTLELNDGYPLSLDDSILGLEVLLNGESVVVISRAELLSGPRVRRFSFNPHWLIDDNKYVLRFVTSLPGNCQPIVPAGTWSIIKDGKVETMARQLPLPNDLGQLPIPFFDQRTDREPVVRIAFLEPPTAGTLKAAALVASYFGMVTGSGGVRFPITIGELPDKHAVVLTTTADVQSRLEKLPVAPGAAISMVDHPGAGQENYKLLVVQGRDEAELQAAAQGLASYAWGNGVYAGNFLYLDQIPVEEARQSMQRRGWFLTERETRFTEIMHNEDDLTHRGHRGGTLRVEFRVSPELLEEPAEHVVFEIEYYQRLPEPYEPARLDVEFNGIHLMTLPPGDGGLNPEPMVQRLMLPRNQLRGVNRLQFHVSALQVEPLCVADSWRMVETSVTGNSVIRLVGETQIARLPDVEAFVYEGLPFTLESDLGKTVVALPASPRPEEIGTALSVISNFAGATGRPCTGIAFVAETALEASGERDDDILIVGSVKTSHLLKAWSDRFPLDTRGERMRVHTPTSGQSALELLRARWPRSEAARAARFLADAKAPGAVMGMESPLRARRSVVAVTAGRPEELPAIIDLQGYTEERLEEGGDLLLIDEERRAIFRLGTIYMESAVGPFGYVRWFLADHWLGLVPLTIIAALILGFVFRSRLREREQRRLLVGEHGI